VSLAVAGGRSGNVSETTEAEDLNNFPAITGEWGVINLPYGYALPTITEGEVYKVDLVTHEVIVASLTA